MQEFVKLSNSCNFVFDMWNSKEYPVCLEYTEHSSDHWHSDTETLIDIDKEKAVELVEFLKKHYNI